MKIQEIHTEVFNFLRSQHPELRFVLRATNKYGRLKKGYWFMGGENYLCISFWDIKDNSYMTPKIYLTITDIGDTEIVLVDRDSARTGITERSEFFKSIAPSLKMKLKGKQEKVWERKYTGNIEKNNTEKKYLTALDNFIKNEKTTIDTFIALGKLEKFFPQVEKEDFDKKVKRVIELNEELLNPSILNLPNDNEKDYINLNKLKLINIGHFESVELDLSKRIICLIGENGSGKSTILKSIIFGLTTLKNSNNDNQNKHVIEDTYQLRHLILIKAAERNEIEHSQKGEIILSYNEKYKNIIAFTKIEGGLDDNGSQYSSYIDIDDSESDFKNFKTENKTESYFISLIKGFSQNRAISSEERNSDALITEPNFRDISPLLYEQPDNSFENIRHWILKSIDIETPANERLKLRGVVVKVFEVISKITNSSISLSAFALGQDEVFVKTDDTPNGIPIKLLSQGYMNVIGWVGVFMKRLWQVSLENDNFMETHAICIIDEIDTYLHPKWQRTILNVLSNEFVNTQFIVTTHSPLVITHLDNSNSTVYHVSQKKITPIVAAGREISNAFLQLFGVIPRPKIYQDLIDKLYRDFENEQIKVSSLEAQLEHLNKILASDDPDVLNGYTILEGLKFAEQL